MAVTEIVADRMTRDFITVTPETSLREARKLVRQHGVKHLPVVQKSDMVGLITDRDLRRIWASEATSLSIWELNYLLDKVKVKDFMIRDVVTTMPRTLLTDAAKVMLHRKISCLPVVERGKLVGILTQTNLVETLVELTAA